ncbi:MAG: hypothetical protein JXQ96_23695 [Cyclobacteriaceae bacterium]
MAEGKKSFQMYTEWIEVFNELDNEDAGELIKHIFKYVNDENPETKNKLVSLSFIQIKQQLKRDLKKWEMKIKVNRANGSKGGRPKNPKEPKKTERLILKPKKPVEVEVKVEVKEEVNKYNIEARKLAFKESLFKYVEEYTTKTVKDFYEYWSEHGDNDKKMRYEKEKSFGVKRRLSTWAKNDFNGTEKKVSSNNSHLFIT